MCRINKNFELFVGDLGHIHHERGHFHAVSGALRLIRLRIIRAHDKLAARNVNHARGWQRRRGVVGARAKTKQQPKIISTPHGAHVESVRAQVFTPTSTLFLASLGAGASRRLLGACFTPMFRHLGRLNAAARVSGACGQAHFAPAHA